MSVTEHSVPDSVPGRENYSLRYLRGGRLLSYAHQIERVLSFEPKKVLEVGVGTGMVAAALRAVGIEVTTLDIQPELRPDIVGSVTDIPLPDRSCDVAVCCQVLEHLPFDQFRRSVGELARVAAKGIVISLPDCRPFYHVSARLPRLRNARWSWSRHRKPGAEYTKSRWDRDGHYWEIGYPEAGYGTVLEAMTLPNLRLLSSDRPVGHPYHHFFTLARNTVSRSTPSSSERTE